MIDPSLPHLYINFALSMQQKKDTPRQAVILSLDHYYEDKKNIPNLSIQHVSKSGIEIFGQVKSDNSSLEKDIKVLYENIIDDILNWEK